MSCNKNDDAGEAPIYAGYQKTSITTQESGEISLGVWYPTHEVETSYTYNRAASGLDVVGRVAENASVASGSWPLVIFSHGFSGGGIGSVEICEFLAREGYVVVAPDHDDAVIAVRVEGQASGTIDDAFDYLEQNPFGNGDNYLYRRSEILDVIEYFASESRYNSNPQELILGGHSMGGWTVMKAVESGIDPVATFLFSMGELNWLFTGQRYFEAAFFEALEFPTAYFYGGVEYAQAVNNGRSNVYAAYCFTHSPSPSYGLLVANGNHFTYNSEAVAPQSHANPDQLTSINSRLLAFLDQHVKGESTSITEEAEDVSK